MSNADPTVRSARVEKRELDVLQPADGTGPVDFRALFEQYASADARGLLLISPRRRVLAVNGAARSMLGYEGEAGATISDVVRDVDFSFLVGEVFHDRRPVSHEVYLPEPDRLLAFRMMPIVVRTGEPRFVLVTVEDVTRLRHLETVRRDFVANVSHELRTPIASINLLVETLQRGAINDHDAATHFLHRIEVETLAMARLVEELLELSRLETGILSLNLEAVNIAEVMEDVANRLAPAAVDKEIRFQVDVRPDLPLVRVDPKRIEQVLLNLAHNAIKFTPSGGEVTLRAVRQSRRVQIDVIDTGVGMNQSDAARVFERFYKVDKGRSRSEGAGLGLAIARHLLELHGSQLQVVSEIRRGSRFYFAVPISD